jgi:hypothetical protein
MEELGTVPEMEKPQEPVEAKVEATAEVKPIDFDEAGNFKAPVSLDVKVLSNGQIVESAKTPEDMTLMDKVRDMLRDPEADPSETCRLITQVIHDVSAGLVKLRNDATMSESWKLRTYTEAVKGLKEERASIMDTEALSKRDIFNFDGDKVKFYTATLLAWFTDAMKAAGVHEEARNGVMKNFRDISELKEPALRRDIQQLGNLRRK